MGLRSRILKVTAELGPMPRTVLSGLARSQKQRDEFERVLADMLKCQQLFMHSDKRGARYAPWPEFKRKSR